MGAAQMGLAMSTEEQTLKEQQGVVKWFDPKKGFGFIVGRAAGPDESAERTDRLLRFHGGVLCPLEAAL